MVIKISTKVEDENVKITYRPSMYFGHSHSPELKGRIHYGQVQL